MLPFRLPAHDAKRNPHPNPLPEGEGVALVGHPGHPDRDAGSPGVSMRRVWLVAQQDLLHNLRRPFFWFLLVIICFLTWGLS